MNGRNPFSEERPGVKGERWLPNGWVQTGNTEVSFLDHPIYTHFYGLRVIHKSLLKETRGMVYFLSSKSFSLFQDFPSLPALKQDVLLGSL